MENLFNSLRKYHRRENSDPIENFLTEAFAWLLKSEPEFSRHFLSSLKVSSGLSADQLSDASWTTQCNWAGYFPDMVCELSGAGFVYVFEHKVWSHLHANQLENYKRYAEREYGSNYKIVLITSHNAQHQQNPDEALCWRDVYGCIEQFLAGVGVSSRIGFLFDDFLGLLRETGLAPHGAFQIEEILGYSSDFRHRMDLLWQVVASELKSALGERLESALQGCNDFWGNKDPDQWGRIGISLFREWRPGLFVGALLDTNDHLVSYSQPSKGPDCCLILCFEEAFHQIYGDAEYVNLASEIEQAFLSDARGWVCYNHIEDLKIDAKNLFHPIYVRKPLLEVLASGQTGDSLQEQALAVVDAIRFPLERVLCETSFLQFREKEENINRVWLSPEVVFYRLESLIKNTRPDLTVGVWKYRSTFNLNVGRKSDSGGSIGFNLSFEATTIQADFYFDPAQQPEIMAELIDSNGAKFSRAKEGNQVTARFEDPGTNRMEAAVSVVDQCLKAIGDTGLL